MWAGTVLLSASALLGFIQHRSRGQPETFALWRVAHVGGTAGAVQLIAIAAAWAHFGAPTTFFANALADGVILATWAFFLGPLARAIGQRRLAGFLMAVGAVVACPVYLTLPLVLVFGSPSRLLKNALKGSTADLECDLIWGCEESRIPRLDC